MDKWWSPKVAFSTPCRTTEGLAGGAGLCSEPSLTAAPLLPVAVTCWSSPSRVPSVPPVSLWLLDINSRSGAGYSNAHSFPKGFSLEEVSGPELPAPWLFRRCRLSSGYVLAFGQSVPARQRLFPAGRYTRKPRVPGWW